MWIVSVQYFAGFSPCLPLLLFLPGDRKLYFIQKQSLQDEKY
jgi:hypothetical protein